jgi:hypothetical protein
VRERNTPRRQVDVSLVHAAEFICDQRLPMLGGDRDGNLARGRRFDLMSAIGKSARAAGSKD